MRFFLALVLSMSFYVNTMAQSPCDSVIVHTLRYDLFHSDSLVEVVIKNESSLQVNYPALFLLNSNQDTVASEEVNFFVLGNYLQGHTLKLHQAVPNNVVTNGKLVLTANSQEVCLWENNYALCEDSCSMVRITMQGEGFPAKEHDYDYAILDSNGSSVAVGSMHIDSTAYTANDSVCLEPGHYEIQWNRQNSAEIEKLHFRMDAFYTFLGPLKHDTSASVSISFDLMSACRSSQPVDTTDTWDNTTGIASEQVHIGCNEECIYIQNASLRQISGIYVYDLHGQMVAQSRSGASIQRIPHRHLTTGLYIVHIDAGEASTVRKVFVP
ncbi:MAG: T9SS type A sorting domain-containing protein [Flavobacteriales bacterium]